MKKITTLITTLFILSFFAALSARADLIYYEGFHYPNGSLTNVSWIGAPTNSLWLKDSGSANPPSDMYVVNSNLQVCASASPIIYRQDDCCRFFSLTNGSPYTNGVQKVFASFTVICSTAITNGAGLPNGPGSYFASFYSFSNSGALFPGYGYSGRVQAFTNGSVLPNTWRLGVTGNHAATNAADGGFPVDLAVNTPYQVVEELDPVASQVVAIWVNPINVNNEIANTGPPYDPFYYSLDSLGFALTNQVNCYGFRQASSMGPSAFIITNFAVATTFAEAMTNVWTTNAVPPTIVYQPKAISNYVGAAVSLYAVANGQGLANMTYQWQVSSATNGLGQQISPVNVSGGDFSGVTANSLTINASSTSDSGYYALIATTPWGLSATSSVAKVSIALARVPPSFVTEPVSQTVFRGQKVYFSASVTSPGNVTFTWYSNNVVVTGGVNSSGDSSSLELDNVTTNFSANYSVAVTNDYASFPTNGVVSTNGVLTVLNPPVVSIAYLRSLQDPNNAYNPTVPPAAPYVYQVTGTITTYTNITSGTTTSYFLQDATAGLDIFVTGATFRPVQGDVVTFVGVLSPYQAGLELDADYTAGTLLPYTSYTDTGVNVPLPAPISIGYDIATNLNNLNFNLQGSLVTLSDCYFGANAGTTISTTANEYVTVTNSSGQSFTVAFFDVDLDTAGQTLPSYAYTVSGVLYGTSTNAPYYAVGVTRFADIVTTPSPIPLNASVSGGNITLTWSGSAFNLQWASSPAGPWTTINAATSPYTTSTSGQPKFFRLHYLNAP